jgi:hypothetical protein
MLGNYQVAAQLVASRVVLSSTELVSVCVCVTYELMSGAQFNISRQLYHLMMDLSAEILRAIILV